MRKNTGCSPRGVAPLVGRQVPSIEGCWGAAGRRSVKSLLLTLTAKLAKDASGKEFIDLRMPGNRLTDPCCRIVIPVVLTPMPNEDGTS